MSTVCLLDLLALCWSGLDVSHLSPGTVGGNAVRVIPASDGNGTGLQLPESRDRRSDTQPSQPATATVWSSRKKRHLAGRPRSWWENVTCKSNACVYPVRERDRSDAVAQHSGMGVSWRPRSLGRPQQSASEASWMSGWPRLLSPGCLFPKAPRHHRQQLHFTR